MTSFASSVRLARPVTRLWWPGSMKSGPTLKGATVYPLAVSAAINPRVMVVLPAPLWVPAMTIPLMTTSCNDDLL